MLGVSGTLKLERLDEGQGIEAAMVANNAQYHHTCTQAHTATLNYKRANNDTRQERRGKIWQLQRSAPDHIHPYQEGNIWPKKFFSGKPAGIEGLHEAATLQTDGWVLACATLLEDAELLDHLSAGDMVALETKSHTNCLVGLYNRAGAKSVGHCIIQLC